jgi:hypothetical protein
MHIQIGGNLKPAELHQMMMALKLANYATGSQIESCTPPAALFR